MGVDLTELLQALRPRHELSEYFDLAYGSALFPQFVGVVAKLRSGMDCWIPAENLDGFIRFIERLGLSASIDCAFRELPAQARTHVVGIETLCTTYAIGIRLEDARKGDGVHVFVGVNKDVSERMRACGWYPVVVDDRLFHKPVIDHMEFGGMLGYPSCCIGFFEKSNDWNRTNSYAEAYLNTKAGCNHLTNCFGKNKGYSLNFHLPCSFDCRNTIEYSTRLVQVLERSEPQFAGACQQLLRKPVLSLNERELVLLDGACVDQGRVEYASALDLFSTPDQTMRAINAGNIIEIRGRFAVVFRDKELVDTLECRCDEFGPRVPLLVSWV